MRPSIYFISPHLAFGAIWVWDPCPRKRWPPLSRQRLPSRRVCGANIFAQRGRAIQIITMGGFDLSRWWWDFSSFNGASLSFALTVDGHVRFVFQGRKAMFAISVLAKVRNRAAPPDHLCSEISFSRTCSSAKHWKSTETRKSYLN